MGGRGIGHLHDYRSVRNEFPCRLAAKQIDQPQNGRVNLPVGRVLGMGKGGDACHRVTIAVPAKQIEVYRLDLFYRIDTLI